MLDTPHAIDLALRNLDGVVGLIERLDAYGNKSLRVAIQMKHMRSDVNASIYGHCLRS